MHIDLGVKAHIIQICMKLLDRFSKQFSNIKSH